MTVKSCTLDRNGKTFTLLIQNDKGRVLVHRTGLSFYDAVRTIDETIDKEEKERPITT